MRVYEYLCAEGPASLRDVYEALNEDPSNVDDCLRRLWKKDRILRTREPTFEFTTDHKGRAGIVGYTRAINRYVVNNGHGIPARFVKYDERKKDGRSREIRSKASRVLDFLKENKDEAFYSVDIKGKLEVNSCDIMSNVRRFEQKGLVYVRGYQSHDQRSPFSKGFILTWIDQRKPRDQAKNQVSYRVQYLVR